MVKLGPAHISLTEAGAPQYRFGHQRELHLGLGEARVLEACRNQISATEARPGQIRSVEARLLQGRADQIRSAQIGSYEVGPAEQGAVHLDPTQIEPREIKPSQFC